MNLEEYAKLLHKVGEDKEAAALEARARAIREKLADKKGRE